MRDPKTIRDEQLKDARDYRETLINRRNEIDAKIHNVEARIKALRDSVKTA